MRENQDIFDKIMQLPFLRLFDPFYQKHREVLLYLLFGGLCTVVSIGSYWLCSEHLHMSVLIANLISWVAAVSFAYVTNSVWVFPQKPLGIINLLWQIGKFFSGRIATLLVEELILWFFIEQMHFNNMLIKVIAQVIIVLLNYFISKFMVFVDHNKGEKA